MKHLTRCLYFVSNTLFLDDVIQSGTNNQYSVLTNQQVATIELQDSTCNNVAGIISQGFPYWTLFDRQTSVGPINITDDDGILDDVTETITFSSEGEIIALSIIRSYNRWIAA